MDDTGLHRCLKIIFKPKRLIFIAKENKTKNLSL